MVVMRILGLSVDTTAKTPILLLQEEGDGRVLPIWIGSMEAMNISLALSGKSSPRPLTHDLTLILLDTVGAHIESLEITNFSNGTFYAELVMRQGQTLHRVDCRPSDGITLAVKLSIPIYVHPEVLEIAMHAEQRQDAASYHMFREEELKALKIFQAERNETNADVASEQKVQVSTGKITLKPSFHGASPHATSDQQETDENSATKPKEKDAEFEARAKALPPFIKRGPKVTVSKSKPKQTTNHITVFVQPKAHVHTLIEGMNDAPREHEYENLLKNLDPVCKTKM